MAKRKQFELTIAPRSEEHGGEIERLFEAELRAAQKPILRDLPIERIHPNPYQARQSFDDLEELVLSIRAHGFVSRLRVRPHPELKDQFQLVFGERRLRAALTAGMQTIPCEIAEHDDAQLIEIGLAENIQRQDLDPLEEAYAFQTLIARQGYTQQHLADRIGKDVSYVESRLHILEDTPPDVQAMVRQRNDTLRAAREIARLPGPELRAPLIAEVLEKRLSTRAVRERVREELGRQVVLQQELSMAETMAPAELQGTTDAQSPGLVHEPERYGQQGSSSLSERARGESIKKLSLPDMVRAGVTVDRDIRNVRSIFTRWQHQFDSLDESNVRQLMDFMLQEHLQQVQHLIEALEHRE